MAQETRADLAVLQSLAGRLRRAGEDLDAIGTSVPPTPDAGEVAPDVAALVGFLTEGAGNLVVGLLEAGDRVDQARESYRSSDAATAVSMDGIF